ncbi:MAG: 4-hydroxy-tetrahydrodipicolinate synthase [Eubacteriales bacterium]|nr:4-hydroxy-tetrahydrodipicolinate synthase [Eubacteriales bacterium]
MKKPIFTGSAVAVVTPFTETGVNFEVLAELCEFHIANGTDAIVVAGTTGEASTMPDHEHLATIDFVVKTVAGRIPVIAGTGSNDTRHAVELSKKAEALGVDGLLCVTPYYNKASQEGLYRHFKAVADAVNIPMILYNVPSRTGMNINPETIARLAHLPNINGLKECKLEQVPDVVYQCAHTINLYSGEDAFVMPMLSYGGKGVISVIANIVPQQTHDMVEAYLSGDTAEATRIQTSLVPLIKAMFSDVNPIPVKYALAQMGFGVGDCRMPLCEPNEATAKHILKTMADFQLI